MTRIALSAFATLLAAAAVPAAAQDAPADSVYDDTWASVGIGAVYSPSYKGSDDYVISPLPIVQGRALGIGFNPRPGGVALDFLPKGDGKVQFSGGIAAKINRNRASQIEDPVVAGYGKLDTAIEVGPTLGVSFRGLTNPFDSLSFNVDALWDVAGAHGGMVVNPSVTYFTPLSRGMAISLSASASHVSDDYADYYYTVPAVTTLPPTGILPAFQAKGGFDSFGLNALAGIDLDGDLANGGLAVVAIAGWSKLVNDAADTPFTAIRGKSDQFMVGLGLGYTF